MIIYMKYKLLAPLK